MATDLPTRVLVVDDHRDAADTLSDLLASYGYVTSTAYDGYMALDAALSFEPHIVILDLGMPRFSGDEVAPTLRQVRRLEHAYFIALTAWDDAEARELTRRAGFDAHLAKPATMEELLAVLETGRRAHPELAAADGWAPRAGVPAP
jgi:DNA-binding response OmpR family regulator